MLAGGGPIRSEHLSTRVRGLVRAPAPPGGVGPPGARAAGDPAAPARDVPNAIAAGSATPATTGEAGGVLGSRVAEMERAAIVEALEHAGGNKTRAAKELGISRIGLRAKMERYRITDPRKKA